MKNLHAMWKVSPDILSAQYISGPSVFPSPFVIITPALHEVELLNGLTNASRTTLASNPQRRWEIKVCRRFTPLTKRDHSELTRLHTTALP